MVKEGKFYYPIAEVIYEPGHSLSPAGYHITPALLEDGSPLLPEFLQRVIAGLETTVKGLSRTGGEKYEEYKAILDELKKIEW